MDGLTANYGKTHLTPEEITSLLSGFRADSLKSSTSSGTIYKGIQVSLDRDVAIKILPKDIGANSAVRHAFENDAKTMARLNHENLVDIYDFGEINDMLYIISEHIAGSSLYDVAHDKHVGQEEAARLAVSICKGLQCAHNAGVLHRSLNPTNILIDNEAEPKIVDFGMSSFVHNGFIDELAGYCAPEVMQEGAHIDLKADIYSVGIILYELIVGYLPSNPYVAPSQLRESSTLIDKILLRALQPKPINRYASAQDMAQDLEAFLATLTAPEAQTSNTSTRLTAAPESTIAPLPINKLSDVKSNNALPAIITLLVVAGICYAAFRYYQTLDLVTDAVEKPKTENILKNAE